MIGRMWDAAVALSASPLLWALVFCAVVYGFTVLVARRG